MGVGHLRYTLWMGDYSAAENRVQLRQCHELVTRLSAAPVLGVSMGNVSVLRLDRIDSLAPGNKLFKLEGILSELAQCRSPLRGRSDNSRFVHRPESPVRRTATERAPTSFPTPVHDYSRLVSFGGPWSNHLHALAAVGRERGLQTVGVIR